MFFNQEDIQQFEKVVYNFITVKEDEHTFTLTLNRPEKRNAFTPTMVNEMAFALQYAQTKQNIWCIIIKANGPVFCAGMDMNIFDNSSLDTFNASLPQPQQNTNLAQAFQQLTKPTIAVVEGAVFAGGFLIICNCTFVISIEETTFGLPEVKRGLFPMQVMASLLNIMPQKQALQLCILGENITAQQAKSYGIVSHITTKEEIEYICGQLQQTIIGNAPLAISKGIQATHQLNHIPAENQMNFLVEELNQLKNSSDFKEGLAAFKEKRNAVWKNE